MQNLTKEWKQPPAFILQQVNFYNVFILCSWLRIIRRSNQGVQLMNFYSQILFLIPFYMPVASSCYHERLCRTMRTPTVSYLIKYFYSFLGAELNNIEREDEVSEQEFSYEEVIMEIEVMNIFNNCISVYQLFSFK